MTPGRKLFLVTSAAEQTPSTCQVSVTGTQVPTYPQTIISFLEGNVFLLVNNYSLNFTSIVCSVGSLFVKMTTKLLFTVLTKVLHVMS